MQINVNFSLRCTDNYKFHLRMVQNNCSLFISRAVELETEIQRAWIDRINRCSSRSTRTRITWLTNTSTITSWGSSSSNISPSFRCAIKLGTHWGLVTQYMYCNTCIVLQVLQCVPSYNSLKTFLFSNWSGKLAELSWRALLRIVLL